MGNNAKPDANYSSVDITGDFCTTVDGFGYDDYANTILGMITDVRFPSPFTFGIFGEWGNGKTSLDLLPYLDIIELGLKRNPRTYKRFINTLAFHKRLAGEKGLLEESNPAADGSDTPGTKKEEPKKNENRTPC